MIPFFLSLVVLIFGSFVFQFFLPPVLLLNGAAILFAPTLYFYGCLSLPFPLMLGLTFITGLLNDLFMVPQVKGHVDYTAGANRFADRPIPHAAGIITVQHVELSVRVPALLCLSPSSGLKV